MAGIEFTNRASTVPAWRVDSASSVSAPTASSSSQVNAQSQSTSKGGIKRKLRWTEAVLMKRPDCPFLPRADETTGTHSAALPPPSPFDPKDANTQSRPIFGENVRYLFKPPHIAQTQPSHASTSYPIHEIADVIMRDAELSPQRPTQQQAEDARSGRSRTQVDDCDKENDRGRVEDESPERRMISNAAVRRLARRQNGDLKSRSRRYRSRALNGERGGEEDEEDDDASDEYDEYGSPKKKGVAVTRNTSNHYTLNMPGPAPVKADTPYILLGRVNAVLLDDVADERSADTSNSCSTSR